MSYWGDGDFEYDVTLIDKRVVRVRADDQHAAGPSRAPLRQA